MGQSTQSNTLGIERSGSLRWPSGCIQMQAIYSARQMRDSVGMAQVRT